MSHDDWDDDYLFFLIVPIYHEDLINSINPNYRHPNCFIIL